MGGDEIASADFGVGLVVLTALEATFWRFATGCTHCSSRSLESCLRGTREYVGVYEIDKDLFHCFGRP